MGEAVLVKIIRFGIKRRLVGVMSILAMTIWGFEWAHSSQSRCDGHKPGQVGWSFFYNLSSGDLIDFNFNLPSIIANMVDWEDDEMRKWSW